MNSPSGDYGNYYIFGVVAAGTYTGSWWQMPASANQNYSGWAGKAVTGQLTWQYGTNLPLSTWTWLPMPAAVMSANDYYFFPVDSTTGNPGHGPAQNNDVYSDCHQCEVGGYETSYVATTTASATRNGDAIQLTNATVLPAIISGRLNWVFDFEALAAMGNYSTDSSTVYLYSDPNDSTTYVRLNVSTGVLTVSVSGTTNTTSAISWNQGDRVQIYVGTGGSSATVVDYRTAPYSTQTFGSTTVCTITGSALGSIAPSGAINVMSAAGSNVLGSILFEIQPYLPGQGPTWL